jgi:hypothetical protein
MDATRERDRRAFADLAKLASSSTPPPPSQRAIGHGAHGAHGAPASVRPPAPPRSTPILPKPNADSSGLIDLQALMGAQPGWLDDAVARAKVKNPAPSSLAPLAAPLSAPTIETMETLAPPAKSKAGYFLATGIALGAIAAACGFAWHVHQQNQLALARFQAAAAATVAPVSAPAIPPPAAVQTTAAVAAAAVPPPAAAPVAAAAPAPAAPAAASPAIAAAAAAAEDDDEPATKGKHHGKHGKGHHGVAAAAADPTPAPTPAPPKGDDIFARAAGASAPPPAAAAPVAPPPPKASKLPRDDSPLGAALRQAAGGDAPAPKAAPAAAPADDPAPAPKRAAPTDRPDRPSPSTVTSALQAQLPAARGCVASASGPSKVRVTFASEGNVSSVDVSGAAESAPAMVKCLKSAMGKAHVPPFGQPTYSAAVNVRPE